MTRRVPLLLTVLVALVVALAPAPAPADTDVARGPSGRPLLAYSESGCTEINFDRGGLTSAVRPLVPVRFALRDFPGVPAGAPSRVYLNVTEVTCDRGRFPGYPTRRGPYTFLIVSAYVTATEGEQRNGAYVIFFATENRTQLAAFRRLGWPVTPLGRRTEAQVTRDTTGVALGLALNVVGGGWDYQLAAVAAGPPASVEPSSFGFYRDTSTGPQSLCYDNQASSTAATYSGDLRGTPFADIAYVPPLFIGYGGSLVSGRWDAKVVSGGCPGAPAGSSRTPQAGS